MTKQSNEGDTIYRNEWIFEKIEPDEKRKIVHSSSQYSALHQYINQYVQMYFPPPPLFVPFIGIYHVYDHCYSFIIGRKTRMSKDIVLKTYCTQYIQYNIFMTATVAL